MRHFFNVLKLQLKLKINIHDNKYLLKMNNNDKNKRTEITKLKY